jgi:hypothetical protein
MMMDPNKVLNGDGAKYPVRGGDMKRAHRALIEFKGVELKVDYAVDGYYMAATETDDSSAPCCIVKAVYIDGQDVTRLLEEFRDEIAMAVERQWEAA